MFKACVSNPLKRMANEWRALGLGIIGTLVLAALGFALVEGTSVLDGFYWASTTLSTVGYGDLSPATAAGEMLTIAFQMWSIFVLVPCAVANFVDSLRVDEHKMTHAEQEWMFKEIEENARAAGRTPAPQPHDYE